MKLTENQRTGIICLVCSIIVIISNIILYYNINSLFLLLYALCAGVLGIIVSVLLLKL